MNKVMEWWMPKWQAFEKKFPRLSKWVYQIAFFFLFSMGVTGSACSKSPSHSGCLHGILLLKLPIVH